MEPGIGRKVLQVALDALLVTHFVAFKFLLGASTTILLMFE